jgi:Putative Ig domain
MSAEKTTSQQALPSRREFIDRVTSATAALVVGTTVGLPRLAQAAVPVWATIPNQSWTVGTPVNLDLLNYCSDADADQLAISLSRSLPAGLTLSGGVISGTPTAAFASVDFVASADDGQLGGGLIPAAPTNLQAQ